MRQDELCQGFRAADFNRTALCVTVMRNYRNGNQNWSSAPFDLRKQPVGPCAEVSHSRARK
jgi:hypothetical protein